MTFYTGLFSNREKAIILWLFVFLVWALLRRPIRISILRVLKALVQKPMIVSLVAMVAYVACAVTFLRMVNLWTVSLTKDTVLWTLGTAFVLLINVNKANEDSGFFGRILRDNLRFTVALQFVVARYTLNLPAEVLLVPVLAIATGVRAVSSTKTEYLPAKRLADGVLAAVAAVFIAVALHGIFRDYQTFARTDTLRAFLLPTVLMLIYLPFVYAVALYEAYECLFVNVDILLPDRHLARFAKRGIGSLCHMNLGKLNRFARESAKGFIGAKEEIDVLNVIRGFGKTTTTLPSP